jgi:hypothetical protein
MESQNVGRTELAIASKLLYCNYGMGTGVRPPSDNYKSGEERRPKDAPWNDHESALPMHNGQTHTQVTEDYECVSASFALTASSLLVDL